MASEIDASAMAGGATNSATNGHALPAGWTEHLDQKSGLPYYYAASTGSTVWQRPTKAATEAGSKMAAALDDEL